MNLLASIFKYLTAVFAIAGLARICTADKITLQVTAEQLGLECLNLFDAADSSAAISKFVLHISFGDIDASLLSAHNISDKMHMPMPRVQLSVISSTGDVSKIVTLSEDIDDIAYATIPFSHER